PPCRSPLYCACPYRLRADAALGRRGPRNRRWRGGVAVFRPRGREYAFPYDSGLGGRVLSDLDYADPHRQAWRPRLALHRARPAAADWQFDQWKQQLTEAAG